MLKQLARVDEKNPSDGHYEVNDWVLKLGNSDNRWMRG